MAVECIVFIPLTECANVYFINIVVCSTRSIVNGMISLGNFKARTQCPYSYPSSFKYWSVGSFKNWSLQNVIVYISIARCCKNMMRRIKAYIILIIPSKLSVSIYSVVIQLTLQFITCYRHFDNKILSKYQSNL